MKIIPEANPKTFLLLFSLSMAVMAYGLDLQEAQTQARVILAQAKKPCPCEVFDKFEKRMIKTDADIVMDKAINASNEMKSLLHTGKDGNLWTSGLGYTFKDGSMNTILLNNDDEKEAVLIWQNKDKSKEAYCLMKLIHDGKALALIGAFTSENGVIKRGSLKEAAAPCNTLYGFFENKSKEY